MSNTGVNLDLSDDGEILKIDSPRANLSGPYTVVYKDVDERWAIVTLDWDEEPRLGIRWFYGNSGTPSSRGFGTWLVIPPSLSKNVLSGLPINHAFSRGVEDFLCSKLTGPQLKELKY